MLDPNDSGTLVLGPFVGEPSPHTRIAVHQGILSCWIKTRSEIVVPIFVQGKVVGSWISTGTLLAQIVGSYIRLHQK